MEKINKVKIPDCFNSIKELFKPPYKSQDWEDNKIREYRAILRKHILENEQNGNCAYCSCKLNPNNCHLDHFLKRELFEDKTFCYNNLFASCYSENHCARHKDNLLRKIDDKIIARSINLKLVKPTENINKFIEYNLLGLSYPIKELSDSDKERAKLTIKYFNFNHEELKAIRFNIIKSILITLKGIPQENFDNWALTLLNQTPLKDFIISLLPNLKKLVSNKEILNKHIKLNFINPYGLLNSKR